MKFFLFISVCISIVYGENCRGKFNESIIGECATVEDQCVGTLLAGESCETRRCCVNRTIIPSSSNCLDQAAFISIYNSTRGEYLAKILNYGINRAGICNNCQAKAAFLAIAATMTQNFKKDEATGTDQFFAKDDRRYGNTQTGDGSHFRRRGLFGLRGRTLYERLQLKYPNYQSVKNPENAAIVENAIDIAALLWNSPDLKTASALTQYADGTFYSFSFLWDALTGEIQDLPQAAKHYSNFLRLLKCGGDLYPGQGPTCEYNSTHQGYCVPDCIKGLEDAGEFCGCSGDKGPECLDSPPHIRCCLDACTQEVKMDLGIVLDSSGSIGAPNYELQRTFTKNLLNQVNVGRNKTHVAIINFSNRIETVTTLNTDYELDQKLRKVDRLTYIADNTFTYLALDEANRVFSYENGRRPIEQGVPSVIFVITDGASYNEQATIQAAERVKQKNIHIVSVGVGDNLRLSELYAMCTPPSSENYFAISNYAGLQQKLNQFLSKTCTEPVPIPTNTTVTGEVSGGKYVFFKLEIIVKGNKVMIKIKLLNGKVKLFYSFKTRNPKDPNDFTDYESTRESSSQSFLSRWMDNVQQKFSSVKAKDEFLTLVVDKPEEDIDFVYVGVKGVDKKSEFEVNLEDCDAVYCRSSIMKLSTVWMVLCALIAMKMFQ